MNRRQLLSLAALPVVAPVVGMLPKPVGIPSIGEPYPLEVLTAWVGVTDTVTGKRTLYYRELPADFVPPEQWSFETVAVTEVGHIDVNGVFHCEYHRLSAADLFKWYS